RNLSDAIELLAVWGERRSFSRDDLSHLRIEDVLGVLHGRLESTSNEWLRERVADGRRAHPVNSALKLSFILRSASELYIAPQQQAAPNFITNKRVEGRALILTPDAIRSSDLTGAIVFIESADPGYDWIFACGISGLVTKYGGANSHMAIRCAEFGIAAAIGCGEAIFSQYCKAEIIDMDCANKLIHVVR
ncbi:PEP-utilizing enzyme, partial [Alphaproteobacteria bacterium]|nr:PEP-utilizing enzyme [Alphaproteobacteria bacterium]